ncbi:hypothetical protein FHS81_002700 [Pseudochelatococcus contaminans]|uniref:Uncharacterized protein n=1 Tax=Pseudochelatococcus contaminans TaxID=1538103 RepID=A0A7W5Z5P9_9HYPH|nr:hypothetical protein [Pseudochelatococcus contaminans]
MPGLRLVLAIRDLFMEDRGGFYEDTARLERITAEVRNKYQIIIRNNTNSFIKNLIIIYCIYYKFI